MAELSAPAFASARTLPTMVPAQPEAQTIIRMAVDQKHFISENWK
jgi:hypothetical protein